MHFSARVQSSEANHFTDVAAGERRSSISIPPKASGFGSSVSGGELLMLALATCYCNDVYREAAKMKIEITSVEVDCGAEFSAEGASASDVVYTARIAGRASEEQIRELAARADALAEIQNTVRAAIPVTLGRIEVIAL